MQAVIASSRRKSKETDRSTEHMMPYQWLNWPNKDGLPDLYLHASAWDPPFGKARCSSIYQACPMAMADEVRC